MNASASTRVIIVEELAARVVHYIYLLQHLTETLALRLVSKSFDKIILKLMWKAPPIGGLRLFLANLGDYEVVGVRN